jgi:hypothetical protein
MSYGAANVGLILVQVIDLFPLWPALHTGGGPLDLEIRGRQRIYLTDGCIRVPSAGIVGRRTADEFGPQAFPFGN